MEEEEDEFLKLRAKLYRFDNNEHPPEWKERGTGDVKILQHKDTKHCRLLMRRDKTLKVCANHKVTPDMELKQSMGSDRAWVWTTHADFADGECKHELLAIRFGNAENAQKFKEKFEDARKIMKEILEKETESKKEGKGDSKEADDVAEKLGELKVKDESSADKSAPAAKVNDEKTNDSPSGSDNGVER